MALDHANMTADAKFVEVLTGGRGQAIGYRLKGGWTGPQVVVMGDCPSAEMIFDRLLSIPSLPWIRGTLVLIRLDTVDAALGDLSGLSDLGPIDRTLLLPWTDREIPCPRSLRQSYHAVLRLCADLGMISGRGVSWSQPV